MEPDVLVIGSGQAGIPLSVRLARAGRRVVLFERAHLGGTCVNYGCTPTKAFIASADAAHAARRAGALGIRTGPVTVDMESVVERKRGMVARWRSGLEEKVEGAGERLTLVRAHARFVAPGVVEAQGRPWRAPRVIVNVGARAVVPAVEGLEDVPSLDHVSAMELRRVPDHLLVMGGGYVGCELGQAFRRFGARVTIVDRSDHLLSGEDREVSEALEGAFRDEGIALRLGVEARRVAPAGDGVAVELEDGSTVRGSHLLVAAGRRPNTDDLGCEAGGVERDRTGAIVVDDHYRTSAEGVLAVGDCTPGPRFTHAAWDDHRIVMDLMEGETRRTRGDRIVPWSTFTDPQVARVGLSLREAQEAGLPHEVATLPFRSVARARETGREAGLLRVLVDPSSERILGAAVVGADAAELIHVFGVVMQARASARAIVDAEMVHPAFAEGVQQVLMELDRYALS